MCGGGHITLREGIPMTFVGKVGKPARPRCGLARIKLAHSVLRRRTSRPGAGGSLWVCAVAVLATVLALAAGPSAKADPAEPFPSPPPPAPEVVIDPVTAGAETKAACARFNTALDLAASTYSDFADATAGDQVQQSDPLIRSANVDSRSALRHAATEALGASVTPGLHTDVASRMRNWSVHAAKLAVSIGVRRDSSALNREATELNDNTFDVQMACAQNAGAP